MPLEMQVKLLRVLQERMLRPVGGDVEVPFGARLIAATNRDIGTAIEEKRFREDLYYRINVVQIHVPPLRERPGDLPILASHFIRKITSRNGRRPPTIADDAMRLLIAYDWPGNVRELQNCMERVLALGTQSEIGLADLPATIRNHEVVKVATATGKPRQRTLRVAGVYRSRR
jgi:two-component system response regulator AtoC